MGSGGSEPVAGASNDPTGGTSGGAGNGNGGNGNGGVGEPVRGPLPESNNPWLPFAEPASSYFNACARATAFVGSKDVPSGVAAILRDASGSAEYFHTTSDQIALSGLYAPIVSGPSSLSDGVDVLFEQDLPVWSGDWSSGYKVEFSGKGTATATKNSKSYAFSYSGASTYFGEERVTVPAGEFLAQHVAYVLDAEVDVGGDIASVALVVELWLAKGVGIVRRLQNKTLFELTQYSGSDLGTEGNDLANCAYRSLTEEHEYRKIEEPFVLFTQSNRLGHTRYQLFAAPLSGLREPQRLNAPPTEGEVTHALSRFLLSPDRGYVGYVMTPELTMSDHVYVARLSDGQVVQLKNDVSSPRGKPAGPVYLIGRSLAWAPDSSRIAYTQAAEGDHVTPLWTDLPEGGDARLVFQNVRGDFRWSPDGKYIAFLEGEPRLNAPPERILHVAEIATGNIVRLSPAEHLVDPAGEPRWLPDGSGVLYSGRLSSDMSTKRRLFLARLDGSDAQVVGGPDQYAGGFVVSPDGKRLAAVDPPFVADLATGTVVTIESSNVSVRGFSWSYDSSRLAYMELPMGAGGAQLFTIAADGSDRVRVSPEEETRGVYQYAWSPNDLTLAYAVDGTTTDLYTSSYDGTDQRRLNEKGGEPLPFGRACGSGTSATLERFQWSPNGVRIAFCSVDADRSAILYTIKPDGTDLVTLDTSFGERSIRLQASDFSWSADSTHLVFHGYPLANGPRQLYAGSALNSAKSIKLAGTAGPISSVVLYEAW